MLRGRPPLPARRHRAELGCDGAPGTYGRRAPANGVRIVWHYTALDEQRTFEIHYTLRGLAVAYDDVVDVNLKVWGDEWKVGLDRLTATLTRPGGRSRAPGGTRSGSAAT